MHRVMDELPLAGGPPPTAWQQCVLGLIAGPIRVCLPYLPTATELALEGVVSLTDSQPHSSGILPFYRTGVRC